MTGKPSPLARAAHFIRDDIWGIIPDRYERRTLRLAALVWGGALLIIAGWIAWWRLRQGLPAGAAPWSVAAVAAALAAALLIDGPDQWVFRWAVRLLAIVGFVISTVLMTVSFYLLVTPLGALLKLMGKDPLRIGPRSAPAWIRRKGQPDRRRYYRMF